MVNDPLRQYMFCSPGEGAVALVLARGERARTGRPVYLRSAVFKTRRFGSFEVFSPSIPVHDGVSPTAEAAAAAFEQAGLGPGDVDVAQLQDTESGAEIMHLAETGLCEDGEQEQLIQSGATRIGGRLPVNTDGGCLANGEPIGASGLRQVHEVVLQLRGEAGERQVPGPARVGFTQVYGAPGVSACTVLST
jgi:acetyl-CoA acetyltransferase